MYELQSLENALADVEQRVAQASKSTKRLVSSLGAAAKSSAHGDLTALRRSLRDAMDNLKVAQVDIGNAIAAWSLDEESEQDYFRSGRFTLELKEAAAAAHLEIQEDEGQLMCYPSMLRIDPTRRAVLIDKKPFRSVRPTVLVSHLRDVQNRPPRFKAAAFLEALYIAWDYARHLNAGAHGLPKGVRVDRVYAALTIAPGSAKEYTKQEFGRDLYLLESSDVRITKKGARIHFSRATGTKTASGIVSVVGEDGRQVLYSSIEFSEAV